MGSKYRPELEQTFGKGTVIDPEVWVTRPPWPSNPKGARARGARLQCECGNEYSVIWSALPRTHSCGCWYAKTRLEGARIHRERNQVAAENGDPLVKARAPRKYTPRSRAASPTGRPRFPSPTGESAPAGTKFCSKCRDLKPLHAYGWDKRASDGRQSACLSCFNEYQKTRHRDPALKQFDSERRRGHWNARRARKLAAEVTGPVPAGTYTAVLASGPCVYCDAPATTVDHVMPLARGGHEAEYNLVPACLPCNSSKHARLLVEWDPVRVAHAVACSEKVAAQYSQQIAA